MPDIDDNDLLELDPPGTPPNPPGNEPEDEPDSSQAETKTAGELFKERIAQEIVDAKDETKQKEELEEARGKVKTIPPAQFRPWMILTGYILIVAALTFLIVFVPTFFVIGFVWVILGLLGFNVPLGIILLILAVPAIPAVLSPIPFIFFMFKYLFVRVGSGQAGVRRSWQTPEHQITNGQPDYTPFATGYFVAPKPFFSGSLYDLSPETININPHKITVQRMSEEDGTEAVTDVADGTETKVQVDAKTKANVDFKGKAVLEPGQSDFRDLILLHDFMGGMSKVGVRIEEELARAMQRYCSGLDGPQNQSQAIALGDHTYAMLSILIHKALAESGVRFQTMAPDIKLPKAQLDAIDAASLEEPQKLGEEHNAMTYARSIAIAMTGIPPEIITDEQVIAALEKNPVNADLVAYLIARKAGTIGAESSFIYRKLDTNNRLLDLAGAVKEVFTDGQ